MISVHESYKSNKNICKINKYILEQEEIRVIVFTGGGYGNQRAAITIINRILEIGFSGKLVLTCDIRGDVKQKIIRLLEENYIDITNILYEDIDITSKTNNIKYINLSLCGASDNNLHNITIIHKLNPTLLFNTNYIVSLTPTDFVHYNIPSIYSRSISEKDNYMIKIPYNKEQLKTFVLSNHQKKYDFKYISSKYDSKYNFILDILKDSHKYYIQTIYGLNDWNTKFMKDLHIDYSNPHKYNYSQNRGIDINHELTRIIDSYLRVEFDRPVFIIILSKLNKDNILILNKYQSDNINVCNYNSYDKDKIYKYNIFYFSDYIPILIFDTLLIHSNMPTITEGANSRSIIQETTDKGYILSGKKGGNIDISKPSDKKFDDVIKLYDKTVLSLTKQYSGQYGEINFDIDISEFLKEYIKKDSKLKKYYKEWHEQFMKRPDGFYTLLDVLVNQSVSCKVV